MKKILNSALFTALVASVMLISGCNQKEAAEKPAFDSPVPEIQEPSKKVAVPDNSLSYFSENLPKALEVWEACQKTGPDNMTDSERQTCVNAQEAWEFQPHKARK